MHRRGGDIPKYISTNFNNDKLNDTSKINDTGVKFILGFDIDTKGIEYIDGKW